MGLTWHCSANLILHCFQEEKLDEQGNYEEIKRELK